MSVELKGSVPNFTIDQLQTRQGQFQNAITRASTAQEQALAQTGAIQPELTNQSFADIIKWGKLQGRITRLPLGVASLSTWVSTIDAAITSLKNPFGLQTLERMLKNNLLTPEQYAQGRRSYADPLVRVAQLFPDRKNPVAPHSAIAVQEQTAPPIAAKTKEITIEPDKAGNLTKAERKTARAFPITPSRLDALEAIMRETNPDLEAIIASFGLTRNGRRFTKSQALRSLLFTLSLLQKHEGQKISDARETEVLRLIREFGGDEGTKPLVKRLYELLGSQPLASTGNEATVTTTADVDPGLSSLADASNNGVIPPSHAVLIPGVDTFRAFLLDEPFSSRPSNRQRGRTRQPQEKLGRIIKAWTRGQETSRYKDTVIAKAAGVPLVTVRDYLEARGHHPNDQYVFGRTHVKKVIKALKRQKQ